MAKEKKQPKSVSPSLTQTAVEKGAGNDSPGPLIALPKKLLEQFRNEHTEEQVEFFQVYAECLGEMASARARCGQTKRWVQEQGIAFSEALDEIDEIINSEIARMGKEKALSGGDNTLMRKLVENSMGKGDRKIDGVKLVYE